MRPPPAIGVAGMSGSPASVVERLEVLERKPAYGGTTFGDVGAYELITAVAHMKVNPAHAANRGVADLAAAADPDGAVRFKTNVVMLRPRDAAKSSGAMIFEVVNRGGKLMLIFVEEGSIQAEAATDVGTGWAMRQGHTLVWVGWQGNIALSANSKSVGMALPVATAGGAPIVGTSLEEIIFDAPGAEGKLALTYPAASQQASDAELTVQAKPGAPVTVLPASAWKFTSANEVSINRPAAFDAGAIYQFRYQARDPKPMGLGMVAVRDVVNFLKSPQADASGQTHPLADIGHNVTIAIGISQSGRFLRDFLWQGFNTAPAGGRVFDGAMPTISGSRKSYTNVRWAQPGRYSRQHEDHTYFGDQFPFSYGVSTDTVTGRTDGIFARCRVDNTCPKLMHVDSSLEFWQARASLVVTDSTGRDQPLPQDVRAYLMSSTQHAAAATPSAGICQLPNNPAKQASTYRALMAQLIAWARDGRQPPASRFPSVADGTLVAATPSAMGFPDLSAQGLKVPAQLNALSPVDHSVTPPRVDAQKHYTVLVARTDADGNDVAGVRAPDVAVPVATFTGFNVRKAGYAEGQLCGLNGSMLPFASDAQDQSSKRDPRPSVAARYASRTVYVNQVRQAAELLNRAGLMLPEDVARAVERAGKEPALNNLAP
jgi:hypothetical protein